MPILKRKIERERILTKNPLVKNSKLARFFTQDSGCNPQEFSSELSLISQLIWQLFLTVPQFLRASFLWSVLSQKGKTRKCPTWWMGRPQLQFLWSVAKHLWCHFIFSSCLCEVNFNTVFMQIKALATQVTGELEFLDPLI